MVMELPIKMMLVQMKKEQKQTKVVQILTEMVLLIKTTLVQL
jgi:hypothetical protein